MWCRCVANLTPHTSHHVASGSSGRALPRLAFFGRLAGFGIGVIDRFTASLL
jgi:hypothetical protein